MNEDSTGGYSTARIPADVAKPDQVLGPLTARQAVIIGGTALALWTVWMAVRRWLDPVLFLPPAVLALLVVGVAVGTVRDGLSVDRLTICALRKAFTPRRQAMAPEGVADPPAFLDAALHGGRNKIPAPLTLPARSIDAAGVVDLGKDGATVLATASTVNFSLRTPGEQEVLVGGFARWLNSLTGPVQIASRTAPADLTGQIAALRQKAASLPHPLLERAALDHADFLDHLAASRSLLTRRVFIAAHEYDASAGQLLKRRAQDAATVLAGCEVDVSVLGREESADVLAAAFDPDRPTA